MVHPAQDARPVRVRNTAAVSLRPRTIVLGVDVDASRWRHKRHRAPAVVVGLLHGQALANHRRAGFARQQAHVRRLDEIGRHEQALIRKCRLILDRERRPCNGAVGVRDASHLYALDARVADGHRVAGAHDPPVEARRRADIRRRTICRPLSYRPGKRRRVDGSELIEQQAAVVGLVLDDGGRPRVRIGNDFAQIAACHYLTVGEVVAVIEQARNLGDAIERQAARLKHRHRQRPRHRRVR